MSRLFTRFGALEFIEPETTPSGTLASLDPGRDIMLALFAQAITSELDTAWQAIIPGTELASTTVVQTTYPGELNEVVIKSLNLPFPLLAIAPDGEATTEPYTLERDMLTQKWALEYVLGPLPPEDQRKLVDVLRAAAKVIYSTIERRGHPDYESGALQFFEGKGSFAEVRMTGFQVGLAKFAPEGAPLYHTLSMNIVTTEVSDFLEGDATPLLGAKFNVGVGSRVGVLPNMIAADTDAPPKHDG